MQHGLIRLRYVYTLRLIGPISYPGSAVRRSAGGRSTAGAPALFGQTSRSRSLGHFFQLRLENQNDKKYDNFDKALFTNNGNIEFIECAYDLKSYLLSQTISTTTNGQIMSTSIVRPFRLTRAIARARANLSARAICRTHEKSYSAEKVLFIEYSSFNPSFMFTSAIFE